LPKAILQKYGFSDSLVFEETNQGIMLRKKESESDKLSWEHAYQAMAQVQENWDDFDVTLLDGLEGKGIDSRKG